MPSEKFFWKIISNGLERAALHLLKTIGLSLSTLIALLSFRLSISRYSGYQSTEKSGNQIKCTEILKKFFCIAILKLSLSVFILLRDKEFSFWRGFGSISLKKLFKTKTQTCIDLYWFFNLKSFILKQANLNKLIIVLWK